MLGIAVRLIIIDDPYWKWPMCHKNNWYTLMEAKYKQDIKFKHVQILYYKIYLTQKSISLKICIPTKRKFLWASNFVIGMSLFFINFYKCNFLWILNTFTNLLNKCWRQPETFKNLECTFQMYLVINSNTLRNMFARQQRLSFSCSCSVILYKQTIMRQ